MTYDVRSVANAVLDEADRQGIEITNVYINKLVFFIHADSIAERGTPVCDAKIEAWTYGPVFRELYSQFKSYGRNPILSRALVRNRQTGALADAPIIDDKNDLYFIQERARFYLRVDAFTLVEMSHKHGGPWDRIFNHAGTANPGMEITNEQIAKYHRGAQSQ